MRDTSGNTHAKMVLSDLCFFDGYLHAKKIWFEWIFCSYIDGQIILQSDWMTNTTVHTQPKVVVSDATLVWWLTPYIKKNDANQFFGYIVGQRILATN